MDRLSALLTGCVQPLSLVDKCSRLSDADQRSMLQASSSFSCETTCAGTCGNLGWLCFLVQPSNHTAVCTRGDCEWCWQYQSCECFARELSQQSQHSTQQSTQPRLGGTQYITYITLASLHASSLHRQPACVVTQTVTTPLFLCVARSYLRLSSHVPSLHCT